MNMEKSMVWFWIQKKLKPTNGKTKIQSMIQKKKTEMRICLEQKCDLNIN